MPTSDRAEYGIHVSWDGSSDYDGEYDDVTGDVRVPPSAGGQQITIERGRQTARSTGGVMVPVAEWALGNASRRYSSQAGDSPIAGQVLPGRPARIVGTFGDPDITLDDPVIRLDDSSVLVGGQATAPLFTGRLRIPDEDGTLGVQIVSFSAYGRLQRLLAQRVTTQLYTSLTIGEAIVHLFDAAGLVDGTDYVIDSELVDNGRALSYWYADDVIVFDALVQLIVSEGPSAAVYERGDGVLAVEGRNYRILTSRSTTIQQTIYDTDQGAGSLYHLRFKLQSGIADIVNRAAFDVVTRMAESLAPVWTYNATLTLSAAGSAVVTAKPSDPFTGAVAPEVTTDFTLSVGSVTVGLSRTSGGSTVISFTGGTAGATITDLQLRAQSLSGATFRAENTVDASASIATFGEASWRPLVAVWDGMEPVSAVSLCDALVTAYQQPRPSVEFDLTNSDLPHLLMLFGAEVSSRFHVVDQQTGVNFDIYAERFRHTISVGSRHMLTVGGEKVIEFNPGIWDDEDSVWNFAEWGN